MNEKTFGRAYVTHKAFEDYELALYRERHLYVWRTVKGRSSVAFGTTVQKATEKLWEAYRNPGNGPRLERVETGDAGAQS